MNDLNRIRWECRRGMLELDIVLERFLKQNFEGLMPQEMETFKALLDYPDHDLWEMIRSGKVCGDGNMKRLLRLLREC